jgi:hypothetical protein
VKEVLRRIPADVGFPPYFPGLCIEFAEHAVARPDVHAVTRSRGRMRESATGFKVPKDLRRRPPFALASRGTSRQYDNRDKRDRHEGSRCEHFTAPS